ncbi:hypothetical protein EVAR_12396_1 [Eumeta japonica]|uniref:Uncharacterized protein n=1 Tax=Eumeta variegata TaxID=151549 RepID=A0A4C1TZ64_EUMVA|nr:hypothetical protein EVAR_12396_1 [Eumeta japonica]
MATTMRRSHAAVRRTPAPVSSECAARAPVHARLATRRAALRVRHIYTLASARGFARVDFEQIPLSYVSTVYNLNLNPDLDTDLSHF